MKGFHYYYNSIPLDINSNQKRELLDMILLYFKLHLDGFKTPVIT